MLLSSGENTTKLLEVLSSLPFPCVCAASLCSSRPLCSSQIPPPVPPSPAASQVLIEPICRHRFLPSFPSSRFFPSTPHCAGCVVLLRHRRSNSVTCSGPCGLTAPCLWGEAGRTPFEEPLPLWSVPPFKPVTSLCGTPSGLASWMTFRPIFLGAAVTDGATRTGKLGYRQCPQGVPSWACCWPCVCELAARRLGPWLTGSGGTATAQPLTCWAALVTPDAGSAWWPHQGGPVNCESPACPVFIRQRPQHLPWVMRAGECQKGRSLTACEVTITCRVGAPLLCPSAPVHLDWSLR